MVSETFLRVTVVALSPRWNFTRYFGITAFGLSPVMSEATLLNRSAWNCLPRVLVAPGTSIQTGSDKLFRTYKSAPSKHAEIGKLAGILPCPSYMVHSPVSGPCAGREEYAAGTISCAV